MKKIILSAIITFVVATNVFSQSILLTPNQVDSRQSSSVDNIILRGTNPPNIVGIRHNGTIAAPTATTNGSIPLSINAKGHNGTGFTLETGTIRFVSTENYTTTTLGTRIDFMTVANTTTSLTTKMVILGDGKVGIGTTAPTQKLNISDGSLLIETGSIDKVLVEPAGLGSGGQITLSASNGTNSMYIRASDATNKAGEILFYDPTTNLKTMELDGDFGGTGKSRIIVDELQITGGSDLAEYFKVNTLEKIEAGTILSVMSDGSAKLQITDKAYDSKVVGVISGANGVSPGLMLQQKGVEAVDGDYPIAITGRVYVKADATKYGIKAGDLLTTSAMKGYAMKVKSYKKAQGAIIGKALTDLNEGTGMVLVLLGVK